MEITDYLNGTGTQDGLDDSEYPEDWDYPETTNDVLLYVYKPEEWVESRAQEIRGHLEVLGLEVDINDSDDALRIRVNSQDLDAIYLMATICTPIKERLTRVKVLCAHVLDASLMPDLMKPGLNTLVYNDGSKDVVSTIPTLA
jgi:hypothetical protein